MPRKQHSKATLEIAERNARDLARKALKTRVAKKIGLPSDIDECMAYFTGYKRTSIEVKSPEELIDLAKKCVVYLNKVNDRETLKLLFYSVAKRLFHTMRPFAIGVEEDFLKIWDLIASDGAGLYRGNPRLHTQDMAHVFESFLNFIDSKESYKKAINIKQLDHVKQELKKEPVLWTDHIIDVLLKRYDDAVGRSAQTESQDQVWIRSFEALIPQVDDFKWLLDFLYDLQDKEKRESISKDDLKARCRELAIDYTRGGGLYHFLDTVKGLTPGVNVDEGGMKGTYVSPGKTGERDRFYATEWGRARVYGDLPSIQSGKTKQLLKVHNIYEGFILGHELKATEPKIQALTFDQTTYKSAYFAATNYGRLSESMVGDGLKKKGFVDRLKMMAEIVDGEPKDQEKLRVKYQAHFQISASAADARAFKPVAPDELKGGVGSTTPLYTTLQAGQAKQTPKGHSLSDGASGVG